MCISPYYNGRQSTLYRPFSAVIGQFAMCSDKLAGQCFSAGTSSVAGSLSLVLVLVLIALLRLEGASI